MGNLVQKLSTCIKPNSLWKNPVKNPPKVHCIDIIQKTIVPIFYPKQERTQKTLLQKKPQPDPKTKPTLHVQNYISSMQKIYCWKNFRLSRLGGRINLETFQKFEGKEEKNQVQTRQLVNSLNNRRFHDIFKDLTKWIPNFPIFPRKLVSIFYKNKILTEN